MNTSITEPIKLLWTGGWDSTYRLCEILILLKKSVQPIYLIDEQRLSTREEIKAQAEIKENLFQKFPFTKKLILSTRFYTVSDVNKNPEIHKDYLIVRDQIGLGSQYIWLAEFCYQHNICNLELGFEWTIGSKKHEFLENYLIKRTDVDYESYILDPKYEGEAFYKLLHFYDWPIWLKTRDNMVEISKSNDFYDILHLTWFCHNPIKGKPCGRCNPCKDLVWFGYDYRLPFSAKLKYYTRFMSKQSLKKIIKFNS